MNTLQNTIRKAIDEFLDSGKYGRGCFNGGKPCLTTLYFEGGHISEDENFEVFYVLYDDMQRVYLRGKRY